MTRKQYYFSLVILLLGVVLGCGGGGGGTQSPTPQPPAKQWSAGSVLDTNYIFSYLITDPCYAADPNGNRLLLLLQSDNGNSRLFARYFSAASKSWGSGQPIEAAGTSGALPSLVMNDSGHAAAVWRETSGTTMQIMTSSFDPLVGWSTPQSVTTDATSFQLACRGEVSVVLWNSSSASNSLFARKISVATGLGAIESLPVSPGSSIGQYRVAIDASGNCMAVWEQAFDAFNNRVYASTSASGGNWGTPVRLNSSVASGLAGFQPRVVMKPTGEALVTWAQYQGPNFPSVPTGTYYSKYSPVAGWTQDAFAIQDVVESLALNPQGYAVAVGVTPNPRIANATFSIQTAGFDWSVWRAMPAFSAPPTTGLYTPPASLAVDATTGDFLLGFLAQQPPPSGEYDAWNARFRFSSKTWSAPGPFSGLSTDADWIQVIALPNGGASTVWTPRSSSGNYGVIISELK